MHTKTVQHCLVGTVSLLRVNAFAGKEPLICLNTLGNIALFICLCLLDSDYGSIRGTSMSNKCSLRSSACVYDLSVGRVLPIQRNAPRSTINKPSFHRKPFQL